MTGPMFYPLNGDYPPPTEPPNWDAEPPFGRTLRLALAMKGGISLAVWIGGSVGELDILRRIRILGTSDNPEMYLLADPTEEATLNMIERAKVYAALLVEKGYDSVEIDVLAGASAGGLNAVLYGVAQRAGVSVSRMLSVWVDHGAIWKLLRKPGLGREPSVLQGNAYFWKHLKTALDGFYVEGESANPELRSSRVIVDLSATISDPDYRATIDTTQGRGHFHFVGSDADTVPDRDIPEAWNEDDLARLAYAARSTSSFPGAFEPAFIWSHPGDGIEDAPVGSVDMTFAFNAQRPGMRPYRVIDGGTLDNIPIERALHAVSTLTSTNFATRLLIYLDPSPDPASVPAEASTSVLPPTIANPGVKYSDRLSHFLGVIRSALKMRGISESGADEIEELERTRRVQFQERARFAAMSQVAIDAEGYDAVARRMAYARARAASDYTTLYTLFRDPARWQLESSLPTRVQSMPTTRDALIGLDDQLIALYSTAGDGSVEGATNLAALTEGSQAVLDAAASCLNWVRALEQHAFAANQRELLGDPAEHRELRRQLYGVASDARHVRDLHFAAILDDVSSIPSTWLEQEAPSNNPEPDPWGQLDLIVTDLRGLTVAAGTAFASENSPWATFSSIADPVLTSVDLAPFIAPSGVPDITSSVRFDTISASEAVSPELLAGEFDRLRRSQLARTAAGWMHLDQEAFDQTMNGLAAVAGTSSPLPEALDSSAKLAGSELFNFAAFFSADWRKNDWWWGHMDSASGIVRILSSLGSTDDPAAPAEPAATAEATAAVQQAVLADAQIAADVAADAMLSGDHVLGNLDASYLVAIASRAPRVAVRALFGGAHRIPNILGRVLLPPVVSLAPLAVAPMRAALVGAIVAVALAVSLPRFGTGTAVEWVACGIAFVALVAASITEVRAKNRRSTVRARFDVPRAAGLQEAIESRLAAARTRSVLLLVISALFTAASIASVVVNWRGNAMTLVLAATAIAIAVVSRVVSHSLPRPASDTASSAVWLVLAVLSLGGGLWFVYFLSYHPAAPTVFPLAAGIAATLVAAILSWGWLDGRFRATRSPFGWVHWAIASLVAGAFGYGAFVLVNLIVFGTLFASRPPILAAAFSAFVAGHVLWWLGELWPPDYTADANDKPAQPA